MKQKIIEGLKKKLLLVELPEGTIDEPEYIATICMVPKDYWKLIGKLTDIKEEQFKELVKENDELSKESFLSKLEVEGIYFENPIQKPTATNHSGMKDLNEKLDTYYEAEKKVWSKQNCWLFEIL